MTPVLRKVSAAMSHTRAYLPVHNNIGISADNGEQTHTQHMYLSFFRDLFLFYFNDYYSCILFSIVIIAEL